jgi:transposase-like protein
MEQTKPFDIETFKQEAVKRLLAGEPLMGKDGIFTPLIKQVLESALEGEIEAHMTEEERSRGNRRNGKSVKTVKSMAGEFPLATPRDRQGTFEPVIVPKRELVLGDDLEGRILSLYGRGMSYRDISAYVQEMYGTELSASMLSQITDKVIPEITAWQTRPLESVYTFVWMDALFYKVYDGGSVTTRAVYSIIGMNLHGIKELLGIYLSESEGAKFWLQVLTDLQHRGVQDMLIVSVDNLQGFVEAITSVFPKVTPQLCIVHQIRNSMRFISWKDVRSFLQDLKQVYQAPTKVQAEQALDALEQTWGTKYPVVIASWRRNWEHLSSYFEFSSAIRKLMYTTNIIEGYHRQLRKVTKTKGAFPNDMALLKLLFLATRHIVEKWSQPPAHWGEILSQLTIRFGERVNLR